VNNQLIDTWSSIGVHTTLWNTTTFLDGTYTLKAKAFDKAGNSVEQPAQVTVDNTPPTIKIISPENGTYASGNVRTNLTVTDDNLESATLILDGETLADATAVTYYEWNTSQITDGPHILRLEAIDKAGNLQTESVAVTVDNTGPVVSIFSPVGNAVVSANISITFVAADKNLKTTFLFLNQTGYDVTNATELTIDTKTLQDGTYELRLTALDHAGNQNEAAITITVDNTNPTVAIEAPTDGAQLLGIIDINFTANDEHLATVFLQIADAVINVTANTHFQWNTTNIGDGTHIIRVLAVDSAGNTAENQITVWTRNGQKATEDSYNAGRNLGILAGALLAIAVIAGAIAIKYLSSPRFSRKVEREEIKKLAKDCREQFFTKYL